VKLCCTGERGAEGKVFPYGVEIAFGVFSAPSQLRVCPGGNAGERDRFDGGRSGAKGSNVKKLRMGGWAGRFRKNSALRENCYRCFGGEGRGGGPSFPAQSDNKNMFTPGNEASR